MHRILTEHAVYQRAVEQVARIRGAQLRHQQQLAKAEQEYQAAAAAYQREAVEALREGREAPERRLAPELLPKLEARAFEVEETIREFADTMRGLAREASELRVTAAAHRAAAELPPLVNQGAVDVAGLFDLVTRGDRLLEAESPSYSEVGAWDPDAPRGSQPVLSFNTLGGRR